MPRTKQVRKKSSIAQKQNKSSVLSQPKSSASSTGSEICMSLVSREYDSVEEFLEEYEKYYNSIVEAHKKSYEDARNKIKNMIRTGLPELLKSKNISDVNISEDFGDQNEDPNVNEPTYCPSSTRTPLDKFQFKRPKTPNVKTRTSSRKRSASASDAERSSNNTNVVGFKTPLMSNRRLAHYGVITPKISDTPISLMRRPQHGEVAVSMSGSPLMVGPIASEEIPTVNVPLQDGRVFSIMPEPGAPPPNLPEIDYVTKQYLKTLRAHLKIMAPDTP